MKSLIICVLTSIVALSQRAAAFDLEVTTRPHSKRIVFGDPLYVEVTIRNQGTESVTALPEYYHGDRFRFEIRNPENHLVIWHLDADGQPSPSAIEPRATVVFHQYVFLPGLRGLNHEFWKPIQSGQTIYICGVYGLSPGVELRSKWHEVVVERRGDDEMNVLNRLATIDDRTSEKGPQLASVGVQHRYRLGRRQTLEFSNSLRPGELLDLFQLTIRMQDIYATPKDSRQESDTALVALLEKFPDVKRQSLTKQARSIAEANNMRSTMAALDAIRDER